MGKMVLTAEFWFYLYQFPVIAYLFFYHTVYLPFLNFFSS